MNMLKKTMVLLAALTLVLSLGGPARAEILPPYGEGQIGLTAVVLCDTLSVRRDRVSSAEVVTKLRNGDTFAVQSVKDGWADCFTSDAVDAGQTGWVNADYIIIDPAWYRTEGSTPVYAWNDTKAPRVALLSKNVTLPILKEDGDWLVVSLRGAAGWIRKTAADRAAGTAGTLRTLSGLVKAELAMPEGTYVRTDETTLRWIEKHFSAARPDWDDGSPCDAVLTLSFRDGHTMRLFLATDSSRRFRAEDGSWFSYGSADAAMRQYGSLYAAGEAFWGLFGIPVPEHIY